jgi:hypothetical protein
MNSFLKNVEPRFPLVQSDKMLKMMIISAAVEKDRLHLIPETKTEKT